MERPSPSAYEIRSRHQLHGYTAEAWVPKGDHAAEMTAERLAALHIQENVAERPEKGRNRQDSC